MDVEIITVLISILASLVAFISATSIKRLNNKIERIIRLKNSRGEFKEIFVDAEDTEKDIQLYLNDALEYEKFIGDILKKYNSQLIHNYMVNTKNQRYQVDYVLKDKDKKYFFEVKSYKRPLSARIISKLINQLPYESDGNIIVSKNGFTERALELIKNANKNITAISGNESNELMSQIDKFATSKGITS